jgi:prephenate dehydrogenase
MKYVNTDCILTDVGSSKFEIVKALEHFLPRNIKFVGAHPLAGSEKRGIEFADADIFNNSICVFTPTDNTDTEAMRRIKRLWQGLGAEVRILSPSLHDEIISFISHLPHILAFN